MMDAFLPSRDQLAGAHSFIDSIQSETSHISSARNRAQELGAYELPPGAGATLKWLAFTLKAVNIVEVGTGSGVGALWLAAGMHPDGVLTTVDPEAEHIRVARESAKDAGIASPRIRFIVGDCIDVLSRLTDDGYDLVVWHGEPRDVAAGVDQAHRLLREGGTLVIDRALWRLKVPDPAQRDENTLAMRDTAKAIRTDERWLTTLVPVGDGLLLATKVSMLSGSSQ